MLGDGRGAAGRDVMGSQPIVGLIGDRPVQIGGGVGTLIFLALGRDDRGHPVFVGNADPAAGGMEGLRLIGLVFQVAVFGVFRASVSIADEALVNIPGGMRLRRGHAVANDIGIGIKGDLTV